MTSTFFAPYKPENKVYGYILYVLYWKLEQYTDVVFKGVTYNAHTHICTSVQRSYLLPKKYIRGISLKLFRVDRILEGAVGVQEYKNLVNPGHTFEDIPPDMCDPGLTEFLYY